MKKKIIKDDVRIKEHTEQTYHSCPKKETKTVKGRAFDPMQSKDRCTVYVKVNETDH